MIMALAQGLGHQTAAIRSDLLIGSDDQGAKQLAELLILHDTLVNLTGPDADLVAVTCSIPCQLQNLRCEVLKDSSHVDRGPRTDAGGVLACHQEPGDATHRKL